MSDLYCEQRRKLLLMSGALAAGACLPIPSALAAGLPSQALLNRRVKKRYNASIVPQQNNPYYLHQGGPMSTPRSTPKAHHGPGLGAPANAGLKTAGLGHGTQTGGLTPVSWRGRFGRRPAHNPELVLTQASALGNASTLILYDTTGQWGWLGEVYAIMAANLSSHFGAWTALPVVSYTAGMLNGYTACIYVGSTYGEPIPPAFLSDVTATTSTNVIWIYDNIWQLTAANPSFATQYGFIPSVFDYSTVASVTYNSQSLKRSTLNAAGIMSYTSVAAPATALAQAVRSDGTTFPWAVRSGNFTYIGEIPFSYITEGDRYLIFCDLLNDALAPTTPTQRLALVRFEDVNPASDPAAVMKAVQYLQGLGIPFGFQIIARYLDPNGVYSGGVAQDIPLSSQPAMISTIRYMLQNGGVMINHGYTHQYSNIDNPYTGVTADDCEFYQITNNNGVLTYVGPISGDGSSSYAQGLFNSYAAELASLGLPMPSLVTFSDYAASVPDYQAAAQTFSVRAERSFYFPGLLSGQPIDYTRPVGQYFPYSVLDLYGSRVLGDTLGGIDPEIFFGIPPRLPADILADAQRLLAVRNGVASFFYSPDDSLNYLQQTVEGILALGYQFVSPLSV